MDNSSITLEILVTDIADVLKSFDSMGPIHKSFQPGIGPFGEPQLVRELSTLLNQLGRYTAKTKRNPDLVVNDNWGLEFKIVRPFGDNGREAENWSVNMLHPYQGNTSLIGDAIKLSRMASFPYKGLIVIGYEDSGPKISLDPLFNSFEQIIWNVMQIKISDRVEQKRFDLIHPEHKVLRCVGWELIE